MDNREKSLKQAESELKKIEEILERIKDKDRVSEERDKRAVNEQALKDYSNKKEEDNNKKGLERGWPIHA